MKNGLKGHNTIQFVLIIITHCWGILELSVGEFGQRRFGINFVWAKISSHYSLKLMIIIVTMQVQLLIVQ